MFLFVFYRFLYPFELVAKKKNRSKKFPEPNFPPHYPAALARIADTMEWKTTARDFPVDTYIEAIRKLQARGYSYQEIADFLNHHLAKELGRRQITRGQVYRVYQHWLEAEDPFNETLSITPITPEDAEAKAEQADKKEKSDREK